MDELLPIYYSNESPKATYDNSAHELALLFLVFAVGALVDLTQHPANAEAEHYHQIARAAICLQPVLEMPSLVTIQAIHMLSTYNALSGNELSTKETETNMVTTWSMIVLAAHLSQTVCLISLVMLHCRLIRFHFTRLNSVGIPLIKKLLGPDLWG